MLRPYLLRDKTAFCFVPAESEKKRRAELHARRRTPLSCGNVPGSSRKPRPKRVPGDHYVKDAYNRAIRRAIDHANKKAVKQAKKRAEDPPLPIPRWFPNQLRHAAATEIRRAYGLEAAQTVLGHAKAYVTQVYAERDAALAAEVMRKIG